MIGGLLLLARRALCTANSMVQFLIMSAVTENLRVALKAKAENFDLESRVIRGVKLAELGPFGTEGRGQFNERSFESILTLAALLPNGLPCRLTHPNMSEDGVTKTLGRMKNIRREGGAILGDLHFLELAFEQPVGGGMPLGEFVFKLAQEDNGLVETSFVLDAKKERVKNDEEMGNRQPPIWIPTKLRASDVVGDGDAVHSGFLSAYSGFVSARNHGGQAAIATEFLNRIFADRPREEVLSRASGFLDRYVLNRFGDEPDMADNLSPEQIKGITDTVTASVTEGLKSELNGIKSVVEALKSENLAKQKGLRAESITALCTKAGCPEKATEFISQKELLAGDVATQLLMSGGPKFGEHTGDDKSGTGSGGAESLSAEEKQRKELGKQFDEAPEVYQNLGLSRADFINANTLGHSTDDSGKELAGKLAETNPLAASLLESLK